MKITEEKTPEFFEKEYDILSQDKRVSHFNVNAEGLISFQAILTTFDEEQLFFLAAYTIEIHNLLTWIELGTSCPPEKMPMMKIKLIVSGKKDGKFPEYYSNSGGEGSFCFGPEGNPFLKNLLERGETFQYICTMLDWLAHLNPVIDRGGSYFMGYLAERVPLITMYMRVPQDVEEIGNIPPHIMQVLRNRAGRVR